MKNLLVRLATLSLFFSLISSAVFSQEDSDIDKIGGKYYFITTPVLKAENRIKKIKKGSPGASYTEEDTPISVTMNHKVRISDVHSGKVFFKYLTFTQNEILKDKYNGDEDDPLIFSLPSETFYKYTNTYYNKFRGFKVGAYSVPIRLRSSKGNFEFDANVSIGANIFARWSMNRHSENLYFDFSFGISLTKVNLNADNSILGDEGTAFEEVEALSPSAITYSFGLTFNLAKNVNVGTYYGWDFLSSADQKAGWIYNKKPWIGVGINIVVADKVNGNSSDAGKNTQAKTDEGE